MVMLANAPVSMGAGVVETAAATDNLTPTATPMAAPTAPTHARGPARRFSAEVVRARRDLWRIRGADGWSRDVVVVRLSAQAARAAASLEIEDGQLPAEAEGNGRRVMSCAPYSMRGELVASRDPLDPRHEDPFDRAHTVKNMADWYMCRDDSRYMPVATRARGSGHLMVWVDSAKPRLYHPSQLSARGVSPDAAADALHEAQGRLAGVAGIGIQDNRVNHALVRERVMNGAAGDRAREAMKRQQRETYSAGIAIDRKYKERV